MFHAIIKIIGLIMLMVIWFPPAWIAKKLGKLEFRDKCMMSCSAGILWVMGMRVQVLGEPSEERPVLVVSNHLSYMDIPIISAYMPVRFTPKSEISKWPVISNICNVTDCVYVDRRIDRVKEASGGLAAALEKGEAVSLFPESTTGGGLHLLPFKSSFFSLAAHPVRGRELAVQPVAFTYVRVRKLPVDSTMWPKIAWVGDALLAPHFWEFLQMGRTEVILQFLPPVTIGQFGGDRKRLAAYCQQAIAAAIEEEKHMKPVRQSRLAAFRHIWEARPGKNAYSKARYFEPPISRG